MNDFPSIMAAHGFTPSSYDFESTIIGFDYDIQFALFNSNSIFAADRTRIHRQWDNLSALVRCELVTMNVEPAEAMSFLCERWWTELRYENPVREILDFSHLGRSIALHVLTITSHNAMTLLFNISKEGDI